MILEPKYLFGMALQSIPEPRKIAREVQALRFSRAILWQVFALFAVLSTGLGIAALILFPPDAEMLQMVVDYPFLSMVLNPMMGGLIEACFLVLTIFAIYWVGRTFGGTGRFDQAILTVIWVQYVMLLIQATMLFLALVSGGIATLFLIFGTGLRFWILSHFIAEMHAFRSAGLVFVMILITGFAALIVLSIFIALIGVGTLQAGGLHV